MRCEKEAIPGNESDIKIHNFKSCKAFKQADFFASKSALFLVLLGFCNKFDHKQRNSVKLQTRTRVMCTSRLFIHIVSEGEAMK